MWLVLGLIGWCVTGVLALLLLYAYGEQEETARRATEDHSHDPQGRSRAYE